MDLSARKLYLLLQININDSNINDSNINDSNINDSNINDSNINDSNINDSNINDSNNKFTFYHVYLTLGLWNLLLKEITQAKTICIVIVNIN